MISDVLQASLMQFIDCCIHLLLFLRGLQTLREQTFAWQSRYKKVLNSMKRTHFHFVLHRLIKGRNRYTSLCYKENRKPLLPSAKIPKKDAS